MKRFFAVLFAALLLTLTPTAWAAREADFNERVFRDEPILTQGSTNDAEKRTHDAIINGATENKWVVIQDSPTVVRLRLTVRRKHTIVVDVKIKAGKVDVDYVESINMGYRKAGSTFDPGNMMNNRSWDETIHPNYHLWVEDMLKFARIYADTN